MVASKGLEVASKGLEVASKGLEVVTERDESLARDGEGIHSLTIRGLPVALGNGGDDCPVDEVTTGGSLLSGIPEATGGRESLVCGEGDGDPLAVSLVGGDCPVVEVATGGSLLSGIAEAAGGRESSV